MKSATGWLARRTICRGLLLAALIAPASAQADYATPYYFTTLAGAASIGSTDGPGNAARFNGPYAVAVDGEGNVYVADNWNRTVRKITAAKVVTTLAGTADNYGSTDGTGSAARFGDLWGVAVDGAGNIYVADAGNNTIRKITAAGLVTTLAGAAGLSGSTDGTGSAARFSVPSGVAADGAGDVYVADSGNLTIRKITPTGVVTTLAGLAGSHPWNPLDGPMPSLDGTGSAARFISLWGVAVDGAGNVYVTDEETIRKITPAGVVTTLAGMAVGTNWGTADGTGSAARFSAPKGVAADASGNVYVADTWNYTIRKITPAGVVTTLAGMAAGYPPAAGSAGSTDGPGGDARFNFPQGVAADATGNVYVADTHNNTIRKITAAGSVSTLAGVSPFQSVGSTDGAGSAARFSAPHGAAVDGAGNVYVADTVNSTIRKITAAGVVTTLAGTVGSTGSTDGPGSAARLYYPKGVAAEVSGNIYVADTGNSTIRKITAAGVVTSLAGTAGSYGYIDGPGSAARFDGPGGVAVDGSGNVYVADTSNNTIRKITAAGAVTTLAGTAGSYGYADGPGSAARFAGPENVAVDGAGNVYVADTGNYTIRKITTAGLVTTLAGTAGSRGWIDGPGSAARFDGPEGVAVDGAGNVYVADNINATIREITSAGVVVADSGNYTIRKITPAGVVSTLAGLARDSTDGVGSQARFDIPYGVAVDVGGNVYVSCSSLDSNTIRKGQLAGPPVITTQPQSQTVAPGGSVQFTVSAGGVPGPTYQWYVNGSPFSGATTSTLSFANARATDASDYTVVVTNELGSVTSRAATLTVNAATTGTSPSNGGGTGGGGAMESWFVVMLTLLGVPRWRALKARRRAENSSLE